MNPTIGRIVIFTALAGALEPVSPAVITKVGKDSVDLELFGACHVKHLKGVKFSEKGALGTWGWPVREGAPAAIPQRAEGVDVKG